MEQAPRFLRRDSIREDETASMRLVKKDVPRQLRVQQVRDVYDRITTRGVEYKRRHKLEIRMRLSKSSQESTMRLRHNQAPF